MASSVFMRPRARPHLAAISSQQNLIAVGTEDELLAALTTLPRSDGSCYGRGISIVRDINLTKTIELTLRHRGITITSPSKCAIGTIQSIPSAFSIGFNEYCYDATIENLVIGEGFKSSYFLKYKDIRSSVTVRGIQLTNYTTTPVIQSFVAFSEAGGLHIENCNVMHNVPIISSLFPSNADLSILVDSSIIGNVGFLNGIDNVTLQSVLVSSNRMLGGWLSQASSLSYQASKNNCISGNVLFGNITVRNPFSTSNSIIGNVSYQGTFNIDTSASAGGNSIVGNSGVGTITNAATDAVTSNT